MEFLSLQMAFKITRLDEIIEAEGVGRKEKRPTTVDCKMRQMTPSPARLRGHVALTPAVSALTGIENPGGRGLGLGGAYLGRRWPGAGLGSREAALGPGGGRGGDVTV